MWLVDILIYPKTHNLLIHQSRYFIVLIVNIFVWPYMFICIFTTENDSERNLYPREVSETQEDEQGT